MLLAVDVVERLIAIDDEKVAGITAAAVVVPAELDLCAVDPATAAAAVVVVVVVVENRGGVSRTGEREAGGKV